MMRSSDDASVAVSPYIPALDGLRALAILLVIPHNVFVLHPPYPAIAFPFVTWMHSGWIGVTLFFVLSGFLITGNLLDTRGTANYYSAFIGRRALRILPLYFGVLLAAFVVVPLLVNPLPQDLEDTLHNQVFLWTFVSNWTAPYGGAVSGFSHFWSLAVEEQFYLLWPFVVVRCRPAALLWVCGVTALVALVTRCALLAAHFPDDALYMFTPCRMDALAFGATAAALIRIPAARARLERLAPWVAIAALSVLAAEMVYTDDFEMYGWRPQGLGYTLLSLGFALVVLLVAIPTAGVLREGIRVLAWAPLRLIGRYSYGMYVFHLPLHMFFGNLLLHRLFPQITTGVGLGYSLVIIVASFATAAASYELYERRFLKLKGNLMPQRA
jgi:peptidoglycan/LPS O-acetylase OafA/YrhL